MSEFRSKTSKVTVNEFATLVVKGLVNTGKFLCVGKSNGDVLPTDRDKYSGVLPYLEAGNVDPQDSELNEAIEMWASNALSEIRKSKGQAPFYITSILADDTTQMKPKAEQLDYVSKVEAALRRDSRFVYEYRCVKNDKTELKQGPCLWPNLPQCDLLTCSFEHPLSFKTLHSSKTTTCSPCGTSIANGSRVLACSHIEHSYVCCHSCYTEIMENKLLQSLQSLTTETPQALHITGQSIDEINDAIKPLAMRVNFWSDPHYLCLGSLRNFVGYVKKASELEAISALKLLIADSAVLSDQKGKLVLELARLESIMRWSDCFGYLGSIESFLDHSKSVFRVLDIPQVGKVVREVTVVADIAPDEELLANKLQRYFVPKASKDADYLRLTSALREKILSIATLQEYQNRGSDNFRVFAWFGEWNSIQFFCNYYYI